MKGYVYLLLAVDQHGNETHKVGISKHAPAERVRELQTGNAAEISVLNSFESENYKMVEKILHGKYRRYQTVSKNEWFKLDDKEVLGFLDECKKAEEICHILNDNPFF